MFLIVLITNLINPHICNRNFESTVLRLIIDLGLYATEGTFSVSGNQSLEALFCNSGAGGGRSKSVAD